jgi:adenosylcobinamide kinase/adenosylcobinamide-phosphate guanylyltransferase
MTPRLTLLTGGVRSGKSARALSLASERAKTKPVLFVATAQAFDDEMRRRIAAHKGERAAHWETLEEPIDVAERLRAHLTRNADRYGGIVVDCLTLWVSNLLLSFPEDADAEQIIAGGTRDLLAVLAAEGTRTTAIIVTNEVGLGVVPPTALGRRYRDALGRVNQLVAAAADEVILLVSGIDVVIKPRG